MNISMHKCVKEEKNSIYVCVRANAHNLCVRADSVSFFQHGFKSV